MCRGEKYSNVAGSKLGDACALDTPPSVGSFVLQTIAPVRDGLRVTTC